MDLYPRLLKLQTALTEKIGRQPYMGLQLSLHVNGKWQVSGYPTSLNDRIDAHGSTAEAALQAMEDLISSMPSPEERARQEALRDFSILIEKLEALQINVGALRDFRNNLTGALLQCPAN